MTHLMKHVISAIYTPFSAIKATSSYAVDKAEKSFCEPEKK